MPLCLKAKVGYDDRLQQLQLSTIAFILKIRAKLLIEVPQRSQVRIQNKQNFVTKRGFDQGRFSF
jgi:hypothetical protein